MKRRFLMIMLAFACAVVLSACGCKHETWLDADCVTPKTCAECGETEGSPLGHSWLAATCETAKTCEICGASEGEVSGHKWKEASCETPKTCETCGITEGEALGHGWKDATTEAPKTCENCGLTEGERIITDARFTTSATADIQGVWYYEEHISGDDSPEAMGQLPFEMPEFDISIRYVVEFGNDGNMSSHIELPEDSGFEEWMIAMMAESLYAAMAEEGISRQEADVLTQKEMGMTVEEYAAYSMGSVDMNSMFSSYAVKGVYYVEDGVLYIGMTWDSPMEPTDFSVDENGLTMGGNMLMQDMEQQTFIRMEN